MELGNWIPVDGWEIREINFVINDSANVVGSETDADAKAFVTKSCTCLSRNTESAGYRAS